MATAALTGSPTSTYYQQALPGGAYVDSIVYTVPANTIAMINFVKLNLGPGSSMSIKGLDANSNAYYAVTGFSNGAGYIDSFSIIDHNRIVQSWPPTPTAPAAAYTDADIKGASFYAYPGETVVFSGSGPGGVNFFYYALSGS